eukprot:gnl/Chilomastix_cuspidata/9984.p2 GENE.gnl/Chilomastix_cuspidata/9984~~gnl/Chilomastix_cuspidata/9984.p2  ORF type:complete len:115 (+),score=2.82 gnl/Chilomastix_cuspidata/9984:279-623(+)
MANMLFSVILWGAGTGLFTDTIMTHTGIIPEETWSTTEIIPMAQEELFQKEIILLFSREENKGRKPLHRSLKAICLRKWEEPKQDSSEAKQEESENSFCLVLLDYHNLLFSNNF